MRILSLVVARGGSKRVPGKNIRELAGRPLIRWTIDTARAIPALGDVLLSTDDERIATVGRAAGALVPWLRPAALATDTATTVDAAAHALDWYETTHGTVDGLLLLQPTSPFRSRDTIVRGLEAFATHARRPVVAVAPVHDHPVWCFRVDGDRMLPFIEGADFSIRSQDLPPAYTITGSLYLIGPQMLRERRSFFGQDVVPLVVDDPIERIDIDTPLDWAIAESLIRAGAIAR